jgi:transposase
MSTTIQSTPITPAYAGLDVGKDTLHLTILRSNDQIVSQTEFTNDDKGRKSLVKLCQEHQVLLAVMENTGGLEMDAAVDLTDAGIPVSIVTPVQSKSFAKTLNQHAKTDRIDSRMLALFAWRIQPQVSVLPSETQRKLKALASRHRQLIDMLVQEKNHRQRAREKPVLKSIDTIIKALEKQLDDNDKQLGKLIAADENLLRKVEQLDSAPGVGTQSARLLAVACPELGTLNRQQAAALAGLAPYNKDSGGSQGKRAIKGGRANIRLVLYMTTLSAIRHCPPIREYYQRLRAAGKLKMVALVACMRKFFIILNSLVRENISWDKYYTKNA